MNLKKINYTLWVAAAVLSAIGIVLFFAIIFNDSYFNTSLSLDTKLAADFGTFLGGFAGTIFTLTSTLLILATLINQNIENKKSLLSNNFFKMLDYHSNNVNSLSVSSIDSSNQNKFEARKAFVIFKFQIIELLKVVKSINEELGLKLSEEEIADIAYTSFYYGIDKKWDDFTKKSFQRYDRADEILSKLLEAVDKSKYNLGRTNQTELSGYFRNIYNSVRLIDEDEYMSKSDKAKNIKILRAQLSNPELYVFFFNTISRFGKKWIEKEYITKYQLFKNIPLSYLSGYNPKRYFSMVYEEDELN